MKIDKDTVQYVAKLAKLELSNDEIELYSVQLNDILEYFTKLNKLNTDNIESTAHSLSLVNALREDKVLKSLPSEKAIFNAAEKIESSVVVPKIIE